LNFKQGNIGSYKLIPTNKVSDFNGIFVYT